MNSRKIFSGLSKQAFFMPSTFRFSSSPFLMETHELKELMDAGKKNLVVMNCTKLPDHIKGTKGIALHEKARIPGSVFFDLAKSVNSKCRFRMILADEGEFNEFMKDYPINDNSQIVLYDNFGGTGSSRGYWTLTTYGVKNVKILNGGFMKWKKDKLPIEKGPMEKKEVTINQPKFRLNPMQLATVSDVIKVVLGVSAAQLVDVRPEEEYEEHCKDGSWAHIPATKNVYFKDFIAPNKTWQHVEEIKEALHKGDTWEHRPIITSCLTGMSASIGFVALKKIGMQDVSVYDGSWTEYSELRWDDFRFQQALEEVPEFAEGVKKLEEEEGWDIKNVTLREIMLKLTADI
eukprot:CAMPEP_0115023380 /NCGR_PEP_ID=MMETSP0216-20121206/32346_1 /TAXON_ID=223996 /ORGANISM="Protocruzia adherens, Strain Boccale" /LENGTH=346 /DNA_ID=CAMNT_0002396713 /DNA_START=14 /DNA_END=1054 /DNA_ORIENTATION=-